MKFNKLLIAIAILGFSCAKPIEQEYMPTASTIAVDEDDTEDSIRIKAAHVVPTANQYQALKDEFIAFVHFGPNSFTAKEWGSGMEDPAVFELENLDTDQWCETMKDAGMTKVILTVKHHDGFVLWQSRYTEHGVMSTGFRDGKGDVLKELSESCEKYGLKLGVYLSPADLFQIESPDGLYGNLSEKTARTVPRPVDGAPFENKTSFDFVVDDYNEYFLNQLFELLTEYGRIEEVWFDGAHPKTKGGQTYDYDAWKELIRTLAPQAVIFGRQDIRWCGNEAGMTRDEEWNVIPYEEDPNKMNRFSDITGENVAGLDKLYQANFLHYQPAETNTSIREGWFYRNDDEQGVRSADDVFDIYERSVGGNSIFLLNIPPNTEGLFAQRDVKVLKEVGERIRATYGDNLLASASGPSEVLEDDEESYLLLEKGAEGIVIELDKPATINRLMLQEDILGHSERVSAFEVEAWVNGEWKMVANGKNIGYKNILRFAEVTTDKIRIKVVEARFFPVAVSRVAAFYAENRPPQLEISRNKEGEVMIAAKKEDFGWNTYEQDIAGDLNKDMHITYTLDGSEPTKESSSYEGLFPLENGSVKAVAFSKTDKGAVSTREFGAIKKDWKLDKMSSQSVKHEAEKAFDSNDKTYWKSKPNGSGQSISIDLSTSQNIIGFIYAPPGNDSEGMIERGEIYVSDNGSNWKLVEAFEFGNLINDPSQRRHEFSAPVKGRFIQLKATQIAGGQKHAAVAEFGVLIN
ncbi:alpha-L-fucosidase [Algoriphagus chordae]|uniref:alpha-L-fucosidase n=1 Tax=Algoriphagus chordae TaxID=237019 RepID=A0A2W7T022_9BACT|nr:alpha-L-fucosidase [Algoriphagus chordae]PZX56482.1 alpha-L-fucosidase [Algoriphagus chordae]